MGMIYWRTAIQKGFKIRETKTGYVAGNQRLFWHGTEASEAQRTLHAFSKRYKRRK